MPRFVAATVILGTLMGAARLGAADKPDPLQFVPAEAGIVFKVEKPRQFVEAVARLDVYQNARQFPQVRELLDSTQVRRFFQLVAHLEKETGSPWPELIDKLAGGGIAIGAATGMDPAPALFVVQGTDAAAVEKTYNLFVRAIADEAGREGSKQQLKKVKVGDVETIQVGDEFFAARVGTTVLASNKEKALQKGLELAAGKRAAGSVLDKATVAATRKLIGGDPVAWSWFDLAAQKEKQETKDFFESTRKDIFQTLLFGSTADAVRRSDFIAGALYQTDAGFTLSVRLPAKRSGLDHAMALHAPKGDKPGSLPLLEPKGVVASQSFYLDLAHLWKERKLLINDEVRGQIEQGEKDISKVLPGTSFGKLLEQSGPYHRLVMAHTGEKLYAAESGQPIPPFAYVATLRDAKLNGKTLDAIFRGGAFVAGFQTGWKMSEETVDGVKVVSYRFPEKGEPKFDDPMNLRFAFAPSFALVANSLVVGSTPGVVKVLIPELKKESRSGGSAAVWRVKAYAAGGADVMAAYPEQSVTQTILSQGIGLAEATEQVKQLAAWVKTLGTFELSIDHAAQMYAFDVEWKFGKN